MSPACEAAKGGDSCANVKTTNSALASADVRGTCPPNEIAESLEKNGIKRLPIVHDGQVVGIVSRANLVQVIATSGSKLDIPLSDLTIRDKVLKHLNSQRWAHTAHLNVTVNGGVIDLWGLAASEAERHAIRVAAENTPGVRAVNNRLTVGAIFVKNDRASRVAGKQ